MGPTTRPIRNDRPPLDYAEVSGDAGGDSTEDQHQQPKHNGASKHKASKPANLRTALLAIFPDRLRPLATIIWGCSWCFAVACLSLLGAVEWHYVDVPFFRAHTASAAEVAENTKRIDSIERDLRVSLRIQQRSRIMSLQQLLCAGYQQSLSAELDELLEDYRARNDSTPAPVPCPKEATP